MFQNFWSEMCVSIVVLARSLFGDCNATLPPANDDADDAPNLLKRMQSVSVYIRDNSIVCLIVEGVYPSINLRCWQDAPFWAAWHFAGFRMVSVNCNQVNGMEFLILLLESLSLQRYEWLGRTEITEIHPQPVFNTCNKMYYIRECWT